MATDPGPSLLRPNHNGAAEQIVVGGRVELTCFSVRRAGRGFLLNSGHGPAVQLSIQRGMSPPPAASFCALNVTSYRSSLRARAVRRAVSQLGSARMPRTGGCFPLFEFQAMTIPAKGRCRRQRWLPARTVAGVVAEALRAGAIRVKALLRQTPPVPEKAC